jgi:hypothetical protein
MGAAKPTCFAATVSMFESSVVLFRGTEGSSKHLNVLPVLSTPILQAFYASVRPVAGFVHKTRPAALEWMRTPAMSLSGFVHSLSDTLSSTQSTLNSSSR